MLSDFDLEGKNKWQKAVYYLQNYGMGYTLKKVMRKLHIPISEESEYMGWCRRSAASRKERKEQRTNPLSGSLAFTVVSETQDAPEQWKKQTCGRISFAAVTERTTVSDLLAAGGEYYLFCGENIRVLPEYLYEITRAAGGEDGAQDAVLVYTDEDNCVGKKRMRPFFKPDASMQMLLNFPYLGRCFAVSRKVLERLSKNHVPVQLAGNDWYDVSLQAFRVAERIVHIPKVLFSNEVSDQEKNVFVRSLKGDNASCIRRYLLSAGISGMVRPSDVPGFFHVEYELPEQPLVSIIIPNKDHAGDLKVCLDSLREKGGYDNYEVLIAENNSEEPQTFAYYEEIQKADGRIHVVTWKGSFNYSAINNFAAESAKGKFLLFLNNDTEFMGHNALRELVVSASKPGVGASGAMLYYEDGTIQHAGVILGMGGFAAHALWSLSDREEAYFPFSLCEREVSAVTGACLMVRREVFDEVGGMEEAFVVALNDIDFCMKVRKAGYTILFNPYAKLYHYESKSRGYEDTAEKQARFQKEIERFQQKWEKEIQAGDPFYNPNLTLHRADYSMDI